MIITNPKLLAWLAVAAVIIWCVVGGMWDRWTCYGFGKFNLTVQCIEK